MLFVDLISVQTSMCYICHICLLSLAGCLAVLEYIIFYKIYNELRVLEFLNMEAKLAV